MIHFKRMARLRIALLMLAITAGWSVTTSAQVGTRDDPREIRLRQIEAYLSRTTELSLKVAGANAVPSRINPDDWFAAEPAGSIGAEMIPVILQRILPELALGLGDRPPDTTRRGGPTSTGTSAPRARPIVSPGTTRTETRSIG